MLTEEQMKIVDFAMSNGIEYPGNIEEITLEWALDAATKRIRKERESSVRSIQWHDEALNEVGEALGMDGKFKMDYGTAHLVAKAKEMRNADQN